MMTYHPLLAAPDFGALITVAFLLISFIGWIVNLVKGQADANPPRGVPQRKKNNEKVRSEIEAFLQKADKNRRAAKEGVTHADDIEFLDEAKPQRKRNQQKKRQHQSSPAQQRSAPPSQPLASLSRPAPPPQPFAPLSRPASPFSPSSEQRPLQPSLLTEPLRPGSSALAGAMQRSGPDGRVSAVASSVASHLGQFTAERSLGRSGGDETTRRKGVPADQLLALMRQPQGAKQAMILSEVFGKPLALRR